MPGRMNWLALGHPIFADDAERFRRGSVPEKTISFFSTGGRPKNYQVDMDASSIDRDKEAAMWALWKSTPLRK